MNTYEAYERIKRYFSKPGARLAQQRNENGNILSCEYLAPDGAKCAVGCLIPKALYTPHIEGLGAGEALYELHEREPKLYEATFGDCNIAFLEAAQQAHDEARTVEGFLEQLEQEATYYGLVNPEPAFTTSVDERSALIARCEELEGALMRIATPKRPDGTYNLSREACEQIAKEALRRAGAEESGEADWERRTRRDNI